MYRPAAILLAVALMLPPACGSAQPTAGRAFIPEGWRAITEASGDLNGDGLPDKAMVLESTDPAYGHSNEGNMGPDTVLYAPRQLLVLFGEKDGRYRLAAKNTQDFIPPQNDAESPCLADPLLQDGDMAISKGLLRISLNYWLSCGSWYVSRYDFVFRFQGGRFQLIGLDESSFHRASGDRSSASINLSTGRRKDVSGTNISDDDDSKAKTAWRTAPLKKVWTLEDVTAGTAEDILAW